VFRVDGRWMVGNSSITRRRHPTDSNRKTTSKVRIARDPVAFIHQLVKLIVRHSLSSPHTHGETAWVLTTTTPLSVT
jgi:hypothetical protein